jgi:hypothetical protein
MPTGEVAKNILFQQYKRQQQGVDLNIIRVNDDHRGFSLTRKRLGAISIKLFTSVIYGYS